MHLSRNLGELFWPKALRVPARPWPHGLADTLASLVESWRLAPEREAESALEGLPVEALADLATSLWRLRRRLLGGPGGTAPREGLEHEYHHLNAAIESLAEAGVKALDHDGAPYSDYGSGALDAVAFQPVAGLTSQCVIHTVSPTVFVRGAWVRMGRVVVGVPIPEEQ